jgi:hypothetical protein
MTTPTPAESKRETDVHWGEARAFLQRVIRHRLGHADPALLEDLTQEALVRLLRALRHEGARNLEGLMTEIARRTAIDWIRTRQRWGRMVRPLDDEVEEPPDLATPKPEEFGDPNERTRFVVLEYFHARSPGCHTLAVAFFQDEDWQTVAGRTGQGYAAVRKQWSRCIDALRQAARSGGDILLEWA